MCFIFLLWTWKILAGNWGMILRLLCSGLVIHALDYRKTYFILIFLVYYVFYFPIIVLSLSDNWGDDFFLYFVLIGNSCVEF